MKFLTLADHAVRTYTPDKIFATNQLAKAALKEYGEDRVINSTLGECIDDDGRLMVLPTVERMLRSMSVDDMCNYAPIAGLPDFNKAVQISLLGKESERHFVEAVATPGGCGALRHAIWNFLSDGDAAITTNWYWGPYKSVCQEHNRRLETFDMFNQQDGFNLDALDQKITEVARTQKNLLIILNTPAHNPTGYTMTKADMAGVSDMIKKHASDRSKKITLCLDVNYIDFAGTFEQSRELFDFIDFADENVMVTAIFSMSKSYTICGMRCGAIVCFARTAEAAQAFKQAMTFSSRAVWSNTVRMAQKLLIDICLNPELRRQVEQEREAFKQIISDRGRTFLRAAELSGLKCCPYENGYFIAIPCKNSDQVAQELIKQQIFIVPMPHGIRFSPCAVSKEKCKRAPKAIKAAIDLHGN